MVHGSSPPKNNAVHIKKSKRTKSNRAARPERKQKAIVWRGRFGEKKQKRKNNTSTSTTAVRSRPAVCSSRKGRKCFLFNSVSDGGLSPPHTARWRLDRRVNTSEDFQVVSLPPLRADSDSCITAQSQHRHRKWTLESTSQRRRNAFLPDGEPGLGGEAQMWRSMSA